MIFLFHLLSTIAGSLGLYLSFLLIEKKKIKKNQIILFFLFLGFGMFIHLLFDGLTNPKEDFIRVYINLDFHSKDLTLNYKSWLII